MTIAKTATNVSQYRIHDYYYDRARDGLRDVLKALSSIHSVQTVLLPGYIGWSAREGSGIWDPVSAEESLSVRFYRMTADLNIDLNGFERLLCELKNVRFVLLLVNYFGFVDANAFTVANLARLHGGVVVEDNAHAFFSYQFRERDMSDIVFFSLHKMFPFANGGSVRILSESLASIPLNGRSAIGSDCPWSYDISGIARARRRNFQILDDMICSAPANAQYFLPLRKLRSISDVPQSYPIRLKSGNRNQVYHELNEMGFGVVSLYHTLIEPLCCSAHEDAVNLSRHILNLPVHQGADSAQYGALVDALRASCVSSME